MGHSKRGWGAGAIVALALNLVACGSERPNEAPELLGEAQQAVQVDWFSVHRPASAAQACGAATDLAPIPSSFDSYETGLSEVLVAHFQNEWGRLQRVCEGTWEIPIPSRVRDPATIVDSARIFIDDVTGGASGQFEVTLYAADGQPSVSDFTAPPGAVSLGRMWGSTLHEYSGPSVDEAFEQLRSSEFLGIRLIPDYSNGYPAWARFQGINAANPPAGHRSHLELGYHWFQNTAPSLSLSSPRQPVTIAHDAQVQLRASASDAEDGGLEPSITWFSDISGSVGQGSPISVTLPPGVHTLTASVTDSGGLSASKTSALVTVLPPPDPCAAAPGDIDRDSVCDALDRCYGYDDRRDADADGIADACDGLLSVGFAHTCANVAGGPLTCWGWNFYGQASPPAGESFTQVTAGQVHTCGLRADGTARCWGDGRLGELAVPADATFKELTAGWSHTCGIRPDGSITCWGLNDRGQATPPPGNDFASVKPGRFHTCALRTNGSVMCWGYDPGFGRLTPPAGVFARIANHEVHGCALTAEGTPKCWGVNGSAMSKPPVGVSFTLMTASQYDTCGIDLEGNLRCFGSGYYGTNTPPAGDGHTQVAFFARHACARARAGGIECWGDQTGPGGSNSVPAALR